MTDKETSQSTPKSSTSENQGPSLQRQNSTSTIQTLLPSYSASDKPPSYSQREPNRTVPSQTARQNQHPQAGASAATIRAIMGDPPPPEERNKMSLRERISRFNQRFSDQSRDPYESKGAWNAYGIPIQDPDRRK